MKLNEIKNLDGATRDGRRVGRGIGSSKGKTAGRGVKGQNSRSGVAIKGFEGGQMPIYRRLPKRGFSNARFKKDYTIVSLGRLQQAVDAKKLDAKKPVTAEALVEAGVVRRIGDGVRILAGGELKAKLTCEVAGASANAVAAIEKAGGSVSTIDPAVKPEGDAKAAKPKKGAAKKTEAKESATKETKSDD